MYKQHVDYLACPTCNSDLALIRAQPPEAEIVESGALVCRGCGANYEIVRGVPRFVPAENYAGSFGWQWNTHPRTQYDSYTGVNISRNRFRAETRWPLNLEGQTILEVGSGSGRFTEQAIATGAFVASLDYSSAVDANYSSHGRLRNVLIVQGDIYRMPFRRDFFDKVFCIGVLQHTPDVEGAFLSLPKYLKPGGSLAIDVYAYNWKVFFKSHYLWRIVTTRLPHQSLYSFVRRYVDLMWPFLSITGRIPGGRLFNRAIFCIADYRGKVNLPEAILKEWAVLDTFDTLSPQYDKPQFLSTVRKWFRKAGMVDVDVRFGHNGIEGRGVKPETRV